MSLDIDSVYRYTTLIVGIGLAIKALETLYLLSEYEKRGMLDYAITGNELFLTGRLSTLLGQLYSKPGVSVLSCLSLVSVLALFVVDYGSLAYRVAVLVLIAANVALYYRQAFGLDGADQMSLLILLTILLCSFGPDDVSIKQIGILFIALQLALSYLVSGCAKLISHEWRSGLAIAGILSTYTYGSNFTRKLVTRNKVVCVVGCWGVILTEIAIPFGLLLNDTGVIVALGVGLSMHLAIAVIMGLNDFVWSFAAAYPSFYYVGVVLIANN